MPDKETEVIDQSAEVARLTGEVAEWKAKAEAATADAEGCRGADNVPYVTIMTSLTYPTKTRKHGFAVKWPLGHLVRAATSGSTALAGPVTCSTSTLMLEATSW